MKLAENFILHLRHFICYIKIVIIKTSPHIAERSKYVLITVKNICNVLSRWAVEDASTYTV